MGISDYVGIRGKAYPTQGFQLPKVTLLNLAIDGLVGFEENLDFLKDAKTWQSNGLWDRFRDLLELLMIDGRAGWTLFQEGVTVFDFPHSALIVAKEINSLVHETGYSLEKFVAVPFEIQKWGLTLLAETDRGTQKFLLDTGATRSVIKKTLFQDDIPVYVTEKLAIGNRGFGPWQFLLFEYNSKMECDGILGVDFFKRHRICLDFQNRMAYIQKCTSVH